MKAQITFETSENSLPRTQRHILEDLNRIFGIGMPLDASLDFFTFIARSPQ
jgi:hypothetical protein